MGNRRIPFPSLPGMRKTDGGNLSQSNPRLHNMTICQNCGNEIREGRKHNPDNEKVECMIVNVDTEQVVGFSRRKPGKEPLQEMSKPPPFIGDRGAVPDMDKLTASIQTDPNELWWRGAKCDLCIYEATILYDEVYYCSLHWKHLSRR